jgi:hypothetical protein
VHVIRIAAAGLIGLACALVGAQAPARAAGASLAVNPGHGGKLAAFTVVYQYPTFGAGGCSARIGVLVTFTWDGSLLGEALLNRDTCRARLQASPPPFDRAPGQHRISAVVASDARARASTIYIVDAVTPSASTTQWPRGTPSPSPAASSQAARPASPHTIAPVQGDGAQSPVEATGVPAALGSAADSPVPGSDEQAAWVGWALAFGALLVLAGAGTLALAIVRSRRERVDY